MNIITLPLGDFQTNTYLVWDENKNCAIIDPGYCPEVILETARKNGLNICAILLTHGHFDHVGGVKALASTLHCSVWLNEKELTLPGFMTAGELYYTHGYGEGDKVSVGSLTFTVLETPGHTPGSVCLLCEDSIFSGDTLFSMGCGRTDFPGSSPTDMRSSLRRLGALDGDFKVYPGHGAATTLSREREMIPFYM